MDYRDLLYDVSDGIATVTLNRPDRMNAINVGAVVVKDFGRLIGILSERDLLRAMAARVHTSEARVRQWMTPDPITTTLDTDVAEAARIMLEKGFRHLPVVEDDQAVGIVSIRDVMRWTVQETVQAEPADSGATG